jgi:pimeloyl-ACP methyl ester carboxylesterase
MTPIGMRLGEWSLKKFPHSTIKQLIAGESTYSPTRVNEVTESVLQDLAAVEFLTKLTQSSSPWQDRKPGFENDIKVIRSVENEPLPLESVQCPTLIVHGTADGDVPYFVATRAHARIENSELYTMDDACHLLWIDPATAEKNRHQTNFVSAHA